MSEEYEINNEFAEWMKSNWVIAGGLISQATASKILQRTTGRIAQMITEGKIEGIYRYENIVFVSYAEIMKILKKQEDEERVLKIQQKQKEERDEMIERMMKLKPTN